MLTLVSLGKENIFQFHKGTIKTHDRKMSYTHKNDFNSIKVRLKPFRCYS